MTVHAVKIQSKCFETLIKFASKFFSGTNDCAGDRTDNRNRSGTYHNPIMPPAAGCIRRVRIGGSASVRSPPLFSASNVMTSSPSAPPIVGVIMGSRNDWETMKYASETLDQLGIVHEKRVVSAHRTPQQMMQYASSAAHRGLKVIIAGAGGAAHLPGMVASETTLPVIGVPIQSRALQGLDSLLSIVQMPGGIPVATMAIGQAGAKNAAILAARILALEDDALRYRLQQLMDQQTDDVLATSEL